MVDPDDEAGRGEALMAGGAAVLVAGVEAHAGAWVAATVRRILDAWGGADDATHARALAAADAAGPIAADRVASELRRLFAQDVADQRATPLQILRTLRVEPTAVLHQAGVPPVARDGYDERAFPDDMYGIVPHSPNDLGDEELGGALLAWGLGKAKVLRTRARRAAGDAEGLS